MTGWVSPCVGVQVISTWSKSASAGAVHVRVTLAFPPAAPSPLTSAGGLVSVPVPPPPVTKNVLSADPVAFPSETISLILYVPSQSGVIVACTLVEFVIVAAD